jgi:hypothetical protein
LFHFGVILTFTHNLFSFFGGVFRWLIRLGLNVNFLSFSETAKKQIKSTGTAKTGYLIGLAGSSGVFPPQMRNHNKTRLDL